MPYAITLTGTSGAAIAVLATALTILVCLGAVFALMMWLAHLEDTLPTGPVELDQPRRRR